MLRSRSEADDTGSKSFARHPHKALAWEGPQCVCP
jgi:hypothetical protein